MNVFWIMQFLAAAACLIGVAVLFTGVRFPRRARKSLAWQQVPTKVLDFDLVYEGDTGSPDDLPRIRHQYAIGG